MVIGSVLCVDIVALFKEELENFVLFHRHSNNEVVVGHSDPFHSEFLDCRRVATLNCCSHNIIAFHFAQSRP